jgi:hypothetical protein
MLGMEIREQVTNYVGKRIQAMRQGAEGTPSHHNVSASWQRSVHASAMPDEMWRIVVLNFHAFVM